MLSFRKPAKPAPPPIESIPSQPPALQGAEIAATFYGEWKGGDYYDFVRVAANRILFGLLDLAGKRDDGHDILLAVQSTFETSGQALFAPEDVNESDAIVELWLRLNRSIMQAAGGVRSCPAFFGCYNETLGTVCYVNAGHTPGLLRDDTGVTLLPATSLPLGLFPYATMDPRIVAMAPGAILLLVSRGIVEGQCQREEFGIERAKVAFEQAPVDSAHQIGVAMIDSLQQFMCGPPTHNDVTAVALMRAQAGAAAQG
jgi:serine phosphatase RsbU (regulator of sigma subunit)